jgi:hypothetical protein
VCQGEDTDVFEVLSSLLSTYWFVLLPLLICPITFGIARFLWRIYLLELSRDEGLDYVRLLLS